MKIETNDWMPLSEAADKTKMSKSTAYRLAQSLGIVEEFFGVRVIRIKDIQTMLDNRKTMGNPDWISSPEAAAAAAVRAVKSRMRRARAAKRAEA